MSLKSRSIRLYLEQSYSNLYVNPSVGSKQPCFEYYEVINYGREVIKSNKVRMFL